MEDYKFLLPGLLVVLSTLIHLCYGQHGHIMPVVGQPPTLYTYNNYAKMQMFFSSGKLCGVGLFTHALDGLG